MGNSTQRNQWVYSSHRAGATSKSIQTLEVKGGNSYISMHRWAIYKGHKM